MNKAAVLELAAGIENNVVAAAFTDRNIEVWNIDTRTRVSRFPSVYLLGGHRVAISACGSFCAAADWNKGRCGGVECFDATAGTRTWHRPDIRHTQALRFSRDGALLWCCVEDGRLQSLAVTTGETVDALRGYRKVWISPYGRTVAMGTRSRGCQIVGVKDFRVPPVSWAVLDVAFSPELMCITEANGPVRCFELANGTEVWGYLPPPETHVVALSYTEATQCFHGVLTGTLPNRLIRFDQLGAVQIITGLTCWNGVFLDHGSRFLSVEGNEVDVQSGLITGCLPLQRSWQEEHERMG